ncbi:hypothetical protein L798_09246 [Zootermopsis nevadensis]|uniref:Uncharacterized protein n=1 Tax=Zootermopsis nevadensis TaxID=136037 RepID=A0A067R2B2_ZOONE|nr:hypothetical protein L798_09246 [Zootermopsis nevadensis]
MMQYVPSKIRKKEKSTSLLASFSRMAWELKQLCAASVHTTHIIITIKGELQ